MISLLRLSFVCRAACLLKCLFSFIFNETNVQTDHELHGLSTVAVANIGKVAEKKVFAPSPTLFHFKY